MIYILFSKLQNIIVTWVYIFSVFFHTYVILQIINIYLFYSCHTKTSSLCMNYLYNVYIFLSLWYLLKIFCLNNLLPFLFLIIFDMPKTLPSAVLKYLIWTQKVNWTKCHKDMDKNNTNIFHTLTLVSSQLIKNIHPINLS